MNIEMGQRWKHYKGGIYEIVGLGINSKTDCPAVIYRHPGTGDLFIHDLSDWFASIEYDGDRVHRFVRIK